jgi:hypothetical protein
MTTTPDPNQVPPHRPRSALRLRPRGKVECRVGVAGATPNIALSLVNVSEGGAELQTKAEVAVGRKVELRLHGPELRHPHVVIAKVAWCRPGEEEGTFALGVRFDTRLEQATLNQIAYAK